MEHTRIDEGMKRGKKTGPKPSSPRRNNGQYLPVLSNSPKDIKEALEAYVAGATLQQLADHHKVTRQAIYGWLLGELGGEEHSYLVTRALTARIAKGDETLETSDNPLDLARGREMARNARLDLERRRSALYGQTSHLSVKTEPLSKVDAELLGSAQELLRLFKSRVVEGEIAAPASLEKSLDNQ